jgi:hypothetical protein
MGCKKGEQTGRQQVNQKENKNIVYCNYNMQYFKKTKLSLFLMNFALFFHKLVIN